MYIDEERRPEPMGAANFAAAVVLHALFFAVLWLAGQMTFREKEVVIPIELTVVPFENLDGDPDKPPPIEEPPPPEPEQPPEPDPAPTPPEPEPPPPEAVVQVPDKVEPPKPPEPPKVEPPKPPEKTAAELREERLRKMRESAKDVKEKPKPKPPKPVRNGATGRKTLSDAEMRRLLALGANVGSVEQLSSDETAIGLGIIKRAIDDRWRELSPQVGRPGVVLINILFDSSRRVASCTLAQSSGDAATDAAALKVVGSLGTLRTLSEEFVARYSREAVTIRYKVESSR